MINNLLRRRQLAIFFSVIRIHQLNTRILYDRRAWSEETNIVNMNEDAKKAKIRKVWDRFKGGLSWGTLDVSPQEPLLSMSLPKRHAWTKKCHFQRGDLLMTTSVSLGLGQAIWRTFRTHLQPREARQVCFTEGWMPPKSWLTFTGRMGFMSLSLEILIHYGHSDTIEISRICFRCVVRRSKWTEEFDTVF